MDQTRSLESARRWLNVERRYRRKTCLPLVIEVAKVCEKLRQTYFMISAEHLYGGKSTNEFVVVLGTNS